jgi:hypothetical protein
MKYYKDTNNNIFAYEDDNSQDELIGDKVAMTADEIESYINTTVIVNEIAESKAYLVSTDYMMTTDYDKDTTEVRILRQQARRIIRGA